MSNLFQKQEAAKQAFLREQEAAKRDFLREQEAAKQAFLQEQEAAKQAFLQKQETEQFGHHQDQMSKLKQSKFERIVGSLPHDLPYRPKVVADFEADFRIQIGPGIAVSIIRGNEIALCYSIGDKDEAFYNAMGKRKWPLFHITKMGYKDVCHVDDVEKELIRLIKFVDKNAVLVAEKVEEERKKYLERRQKYLEEKKKSPFQ